VEPYNPEVPASDSHDSGVEQNASKMFENSEDHQDLYNPLGENNQPMDLPPPNKVIKDAQDQAFVKYGKDMNAHMNSNTAQDEKFTD